MTWTQAASGPETAVSRWATPAVGLLLAAEVAAVAVLTRLTFPHRTLWLEALTLPLYLAAVGLLARSRLPAATASLLGDHSRRGTAAVREHRQTHLQ
jgi:hypothetical protein